MSTGIAAIVTLLAVANIFAPCSCDACGLICDSFKKSPVFRVACGMARFERDDCVAAVYERADREMYDDKSRLKKAAERA